MDVAVEDVERKDGGNGNGRKLSAKVGIWNKEKPT